MMLSNNAAKFLEDFYGIKLRWYQRLMLPEDFHFVGVDRAGRNYVRTVMSLLIKMLYGNNKRRILLAAKTAVRKMNGNKTKLL